MMDIGGQRTDAVPVPSDLKVMDRRLKILYSKSHYWFSLSHGGSVAHTSGVLNSLAKYADVEIISNEKIYGVQNIPCTVIPPIGRGARGELIYNLYFAKSLRTRIEQIKPDLVYHRYNGFSFSTAYVCKKLNVPLVLEFNSSHLWKTKYWKNNSLKGILWSSMANALFRRIEPYNLHHAFLVVVVSNALKESLTVHDLSSSRILVNPNGVDPEKFTPASESVCKRIRKELEMPEGKVVIGFAGTFGPWHGIPELTQAILEINGKRELRQRVFFVLYGRKSPLQQEMEHQVGGAENVRFAGPVEYEYVQDYLSVCDVLVSPQGRPADGKEFFGSPTKLFEYMSLGKGIVASQSGQIGEILAHGESAYLCPPGSVEDLVTGILYYVENPDEIVRMGRNARERVLDAYTWDHNAIRLIEAFCDARECKNMQTPYLSE